MESTETVAQSTTVRVRNVGGIEETTVDLPPGVTVLAGRNATNRTSFLRAVMAGLGSERASIKGDAEEGTVELELDGERYGRTLRRVDGGVAFGGDPYLDDPTVADLFAFLLETNEARQAVVTDDDLRDVLMRPVDTEAVRRRIDERVAERDALDERIAELEAAKERLTALEAERRELAADLEERRAERDELAAALEAADTDVEAARSDDEELDRRLDDLSETRQQLEDVRYRLETATRSLEAEREEREERRAELADLEGPDGDASALEERIRTLREQKRECESVVNELQTVVQFNEELLEGDDRLRSLLTDAGGDVTDGLLADETTTCWTCGSEVGVEAIEETVARLRDLSADQRERRRELVAELDDLTDRRKDLERARDRRRRLREAVDRLDERIDDRRATRERLRERRTDLESRLESLEEDIDELRGEVDDDLLDRHRELNRLEFAVGRLADDLEEVDEEIADLEATVAREDDLRAERDELAATVEDLRTRVDRLEGAAVSEFNDRMADLLEVLDYGNVARVWVERRKPDGPDPLAESAFDLHVVRRTDEGTAYEDDVRHLSESEREVVGLVFALAGYLVHDVHETVPFMVLDSLEAIDAERIAALVDYFAEFAPNLLVALLPEDAAALSDDYHRVTEI